MRNSYSKGRRSSLEDAASAPRTSVFSQLGRAPTSGWPNGSSAVGCNVLSGKARMRTCGSMLVGINPGALSREWLKHPVSR